MEEKDKKLIVFENRKIRRVWNDGEWFYSVVDVVAVLTDSDNPRKYWNKLAQRLREEGSELVTNCHQLKREFENDVQLSPIWVQLKLEASDGKSYLTDCANKEGIFRIIQSIPSKKAEPFKRWLARVGSERLDEIENPELAQERMKDIYEKKGYSKSWIDKRLRGIAIRQDLTDEWKGRGVEKKSDFAILTAEISKASFGMTPSEYKKFKGLRDENLRDHMTDLELIFGMLGEASSAEIERVQNPERFEEHIEVSRKGGEIARNARVELEEETGESVVVEDNYLDEKEKDVREKKKKKLVVVGG